MAGNGGDVGEQGERAPRIAVLSRRRAERRVWHASQYEFEDVILAVDDAQLLEPVRRPLGAVGQLAHGATNRARKLVSLPRSSPMQPVDADNDFELFFAVFAAPHEIGALPHARRVMQRAALKVAFLVEIYEPELPSARDYLLQLRGFDHIFVFTRTVIPFIERLTGVPTSFLATGVDALLFAPRDPEAPRPTTVMTYGRRIPLTHQSLRAAAERDELDYAFDTVHGPFDVTDHHEHRFALARSLQRSKYTIIHRNNDDPKRSVRTGAEETLSNRLFEAATAGAVILGSAPATPDFGRLLGWADSVIRIPSPFSHVVDLIAELERDPVRVNTASRMGTLAGLRSFDWAYRWAEILEAVGLSAAPALTARLRQLEARAVQFETGTAEPSNGPPLEAGSIPQR